VGFVRGGDVEKDYLLMELDGLLGVLVEHHQ
jgi:hypothetical protein